MCGYVSVTQPKLRADVLGAARQVRGLNIGFRPKLECARPNGGLKTGEEFLREV